MRPLKIHRGCHLRKPYGSHFIVILSWIQPTAVHTSTQQIPRPSILNCAPTEIQTFIPSHYAIIHLNNRPISTQACQVLNLVIYFLHTRQLSPVNICRPTNNSILVDPSQVLSIPATDCIRAKQQQYCRATIYSLFLSDWFLQHEKFLFRVRDRLENSIHSLALSCSIVNTETASIWRVMNFPY